MTWPGCIQTESGENGLDRDVARSVRSRVTCRARLDRNSRPSTGQPSLGASAAATERWPASALTRTRRKVRRASKGGASPAERCHPRPQPRAVQHLVAVLRGERHRRLPHCADHAGPVPVHWGRVAQVVGLLEAG